jgi:hypothetical protein
VILNTFNFADRDDGAKSPPASPGRLALPDLSALAQWGRDQ